MFTGIPPALSPRAPAQPQVQLTVDGPAPRRLYRVPHSLPESPLRHSPCIPLAHRLHGETMDGAASLRAPAGHARLRAVPDSTAPDRAADSSASPVFLLLLLEIAS